MLELKNIKKTYTTGETKVEALKGISLNFRQMEFVSILGASGCGKTTLLNIIGGLDKYTSGDLIIDGKSTKQFVDKDWDTYRNHKIGFVFQSYNLINHLSVLENVEMALTLNGVSHSERKARAIEALTKVGLADQVNKVPNQLSGGQMQRVAIARAIVNNPSIILADEPTGALDTKTSIQIMEILKNISKDKLIIMVTHNPKLAKKYSTRIINLVDGAVEKDSLPFDLNLDISKNQQQIDKKTQKNGQKTDKITKNELKTSKDTKKERKTSMSFWTALYLSFKNLLHKKGRTFLTSFAGSIGIIGVALVLAISNGFTNYIDNTQKETLSGYPITISTATIDYDSFTNVLTSSGSDGSTSQGTQKPVDREYVSIYESDLQKYVKYGHYNYIGSELVKKIDEIKENNLNINENFNAIEYSYYLPLKFVSKDKNDNLVFSENSNTFSIFTGTGNGTFFETPDNQDFVAQNYDTIYTSDDYVSSDPYGLTLVVEKGDKFKASIFESLGYNKADYVDEDKSSYKKISFDEICAREYKLVQNDDFYVYDVNSDTYSAIDTTSQSKLDSFYQNEQAKTLKITRVLKKKSSASVDVLSSGVMYSSTFADEYKNSCANSEIYKKQMQKLNNQLESGDENLIFYAPFKIDISEFSGMGLVPPKGFYNTNAINNFLQKSFKITLKNTEVFDLAMQQIGMSKIPQNVAFFANNFDAKNTVINMIDEYNNSVNENYKILYTDQSDAMTNALKNLISIISYVLIAFASISLVVSSIMIGIITYVSVIERTKEIGVLRSLGARKKDISRVFNAETMIIGFMSGIIGVAISYLLCPIINLIVNGKISVIKNIANFNPLHAVLLIAISMILTLISGSIPSKIASKKNPVECLRTE